MKKLSILLLIPFFIACSSDEDHNKKIIVDNDNIEFIYNEPLVSMFGKTLAEVKKAETRELIIESDFSLQYKETKGDLAYTIGYENAKDGVSKMYCLFESNYFELVNKGLALKYPNKENDVIHISSKGFFIYALPQTLTKVEYIPIY